MPVCIHRSLAAKYLQLARIAALASCFCALLSASAPAAVIVSEVAPWSSGNSSLGADWFELTNTGAADVNITGWKIDDGSSSFATSALLNGVSTIKAGESVVFTESAASLAADFKTLWFGANPPAGLQIGNYSGSGLGLSTSGDGVTIFNGGGVIQASVSFGASPSGPYPTFDNAAGISGAIFQLSAVGVGDAFVSANDPNEIGSPGTISNVPEPTTGFLIVCGMVTSVLAVGRRAARSAT